MKERQESCFLGFFKGQGEEGRKEKKERKFHWIYSVHGSQMHPIPFHELKPEPNAFTKLKISIRKKSFFPLYL